MLGLSPFSSPFPYSLSASSSSSYSSSASPLAPKPLTSFACRPKPRRNQTQQWRHQPCPRSGAKREAQPEAATGNSGNTCKTPAMDIAEEDVSMYRITTQDDILVVPRRCYQRDTPLHRARDAKVSHHCPCVRTCALYVAHIIAMYVHTQMIQLTSQLWGLCLLLFQTGECKL